MRVTVIIPTYKRIPDLQRLLESVEALEAPPEEVIVIIGPKDTESAQVCEGWRRRLPNMRTLQATKPSLIHSLNLGIGSATGDIVCLTDDDSCLPTGWCARIREAYLADPKLGAYGGRDHIQSSDNASLVNPEPAAVVGTFRWNGDLIGNHHRGVVKSPAKVDVLKGVNLSFRRIALKVLQISPALEWQGAEVCSEVDVCLRVKKAGYHVVYDNDNYLLHFISERVGADSRTDLFSPAWPRRAFNRAFVVAKYRPLSEAIFFLVREFWIGTRKSPGIIRALIMLVKQRFPAKILTLPFTHGISYLSGAVRGLRERA